MKRKDARASTNPLVATTGLALALLFAAPALSQQTAPAPPADKANAERARQQDMSRREMQLRSLGPTPVPVDQKQISALIKKVEQDFTRMLVIHNELVHMVTADASLNYNFINELTGEINKRAESLQSTLALAKPEKLEEELKQKQFSEEQMKDALIVLCKQIRNFATNPTITTPGLIDVKESAKAGVDLEKIVLLSERIKKSAQRLK